MCPEHFRLKYDGNSFTFSVRYPGKSKYQLIQDKIISDACENPMFLGMFVEMRNTLKNRHLPLRRASLTLGS
jgi:hypothetical protein